MRGNVCIELHNHKTGLRDRIEGHNDVTDALQAMINFCVCNNSNASNYKPVVNKLLGGVILMDKELSGTDIFIPSNANVIGSGYQGSDTSSSIVGTYNSAESGINDTQRIYTHVWDFSTSQSNGTIKSLGLTTSYGGHYPLVSTPYASVGIGRNYKIIYIDETNNDVYYTINSSETAPIYRYHCNFTDMMLHYVPDTINGTKTDKTIQTTDFYGSINGRDGNVYIPYSSGLDSNEVGFRVYRVSDLSFEKQDNLIVKFGTIELPTNDVEKEYAVINAELGYVYTITTNFDYIYKYDLNTKNETAYKIDVDGAGYCNTMIMPDGDFYCLFRYGGSNGNHVRITTDGQINRYTTSDTVGVNVNFYNYNVLNNGILTAYNTAGIVSNMLMTNFNLPTPIEKTSAQSMKVIYTLTQE